MGRPSRAPNIRSVPALCFSLLAVGRGGQDRGLGSERAIDVLCRAPNVAREVGQKLAVPNVIDDGGNEALMRRSDFNRRLGFRNFRDCLERVSISSG